MTTLTIDAVKTLTIADLRKNLYEMSIETLHNLLTTEMTSEHFGVFHALALRTKETQSDDEVREAARLAALNFEAVQGHLEGAKDLPDLLDDLKRHDDATVVTAIAFGISYAYRAAANEEFWTDRLEAEEGLA